MTLPLPRNEWQIRQAPFKLLLVANETKDGRLRWRLLTQKQFVHEWGQSE